MTVPHQPHKYVYLFADGVAEGKGAWRDLLGGKGAVFGDRRRPLLLSVRSGARESMPGMMDTVLNIGLNDETVKGLIQMSDNPRFAYDSYRRFITMFGNVVMGVPHAVFEELLEAAKKREGVRVDSELSAEALQELIVPLKARVQEIT